MTEQSARGGASGQLTTGDVVPQSPPPPEVIETHGQFSAVINCHDCNLSQIEVAIQANRHAVDPHPVQQGRSVSRHPVYLVAYDYGQLDEDGVPVEGKPTELNMKAIREVFSARYPYVAADGPPKDGSHIDVPGMHIIAERDHEGNPTGRVRLGSPEEAG